MNRHDNEQKLALIKNEAKHGDARAQRLLALRYRHGRGVTQSDEVAAAWMKKAAAQELALAQRDLAGFYWNGIGVEQDPPQALRLYRLAALQGDPIAKNFIGELETKHRAK